MMAAVRSRTARVASAIALLALWFAPANCVAPAPAPAPPPRHATLPFVSPDGKWILFASDREGSPWQIYVMDADGGGLRRLTRSPEDKHPIGWTGDGRVLFGVSARDSASVVVVDVDGHAAEILFTRAAKEIDLAPRGRGIAYTVGDWRRNRIVVEDFDRGTTDAITDSSAGWFNLAWSPDGRRIAATRSDSTGDLQVWVMDADGSRARPLTWFTSEDGRPQWPAWSADGRRIAIQSGTYDRKDPKRSVAHIWVIDVAGGGATKLDPHEPGRLDETPSWFPDGRRIAFQSDRTGAFEVWVMNADGTGARPITR
jgi:Tol biopolymer transport system component